MSTSVIITNYNQKEHIQQALDSVYGQTLPPKQVIVVDDCSTDGSHELLKQQAPRLGFQLFRTEGNQGPAKSRNLGLAEVNQKYVNFLDSDDYLLPSKLQKQVAILEKSPQIAVCYCDALIERDSQRLNLKFSDLFPPISGAIFDHLLDRNCIAMHSALVRTAYARDTGFNERLWQAEDYDFWLRLSRKHDNFHYLNEALAIYRRGLSSLSKKRLDSVGDTLKVLKKLEATHLNSQQKTKLDSHKAALFEEKAAILLRQGRSEGLQALAAAAKLRRLRKFKRFSLFVSKFNTQLSLLVYRLLDRRATRKSASENINMELFTG